VHALLAAGLATLLVCLGVAVRPVRTYTAQTELTLPASPSAQWSAAEASQDGLAHDSAGLAAQLAAALKDDAALGHAAEAAGIQASPAGAAALLDELRAATSVVPNSADAGPGARLTMESSNTTQAQAFALALADGFAVNYRTRALARGQQAVNEARQAVSSTSAQAEDSQRDFDRFLAEHFAETPAAAPLAESSPPPAMPELKPAPVAPLAPSEPTVAETESEEPAATAGSLPADAELKSMKQRRRELLVRYTKYHYKVQEVDMHIARLEKELAILAPKRQAASPALQPATPTPAIAEPNPDATAMAEAAAQEAAAQQTAAVEAAAAKREQLNGEFESLRTRVATTREAAEQAVLQERAALEHQAVLANQAVLRVAAPTVSYRTAEGLDRHGVQWSLLLAGIIGGLAFCMTGPQRHVYRSATEVEDDLELPLVAALASRSATLPRGPKVLPMIAARLTAAGELILVGIVCGLVVLAVMEPSFRTQLLENPLAAYADAASRLLGR